VESKSKTYDDDKDDNYARGMVLIGIVARENWAELKPYHAHPTWERTHWFSIPVRVCGIGSEL
jgi:hypothetical protein